MISIKCMAETNNKLNAASRCYIGSNPLRIITYISLLIFFTYIKDSSLRFPGHHVKMFYPFAAPNYRILPTPYGVAADIFVRLSRTNFGNASRRQMIKSHDVPTYLRNIYMLII